ncbi:hypothetical protein C8Q79DRAFT_930344 [Trametes meyenii]|nr:hypothetical protein C8Q79DRAFT_930344 [Trametes meyenii]
MTLVCDVHCDIPFELYPGKYEYFQQYVFLKEEVYYDYRTPPDFRQLCIQCQNAIQEHPPERLKQGLKDKDGPLMLEYCISLNYSRFEDHCYMRDIFDTHPGDVLHDLIGIWLSPETRSPPHEIHNATTYLRTRALACYAFMLFWMQWCMSSPETRSAHTIVHGMAVRGAACAASLCVERDFLPPIVFRIASWLATTRARYGVDLRETHWITHREFCTSTTCDYEKIIEDDGDPTWVDVDDFHPPKKPVPDRGLLNCSLWAEREGAEIFIDVPNSSAYHPGQVMRLQTKTLSPECLKRYKQLWTVSELKPQLKQVIEVGCYPYHIRLGLG